MKAVILMGQFQGDLELGVVIGFLAAVAAGLWLVKVIWNASHPKPKSHSEI